MNRQTVNGMNFSQWLNQVDFYLFKLAGGFSSADLPDYNYIDCWRAGDSAKEAAKGAIEFAEESY